MSIQIYDSLAREKRELVALESRKIRLYVCGPTVYDDCHIGHLMGPVLFDTIGRWIVARGYELRFVNNITDVDDKIIKRSNETGEEWQAITERYTQQYLDFLSELNVTTITDHPRCTEYIPQMVAFIADLIANDRAYVAGDGVYYDVQRQDGYGKLSGRKIDEMIPADAEGDSLRHPADFALWKNAKPGEPTWDSPWGAGRPGWHLECSVMSSELLGKTFDIHGGGDDLKFPHHENEIAQSEAHGDAYAATWMHNGLIQYGGKKIAKSDPRMKDPKFSQQFQARWLLDTYGAPSIRFFLLRGQYRRPIDFEPSNLQAARTGLLRLHKQLGDLVEVPGEVTLDQILARDLPEDLAALRDGFCAEMDDDFGTGDALARVFELASNARSSSSDAERQSALELARDLGRLLGLFLPGDTERIERAGSTSESELFGKVMGVLVELRQEARADKDFALSDKIRDKLGAVGVRLLDGKDGSSWEVE